MMKISLSFVMVISVLSFSHAQMRKGYKWGCTIALNDAHSQIPFLAGSALQVDAEGNMISGGEKTNMSYSLSIIPKYYINNDWVLRFEYGMTKIDLNNIVKETSSTGYLMSSSYGIGHDTITQKINRFAFGAQLVFFESKKIQSYGGVNLLYVNYGSQSRNSYSETRNIASDTLISWGRNNSIIPGGFATGLGVFAGFNFNIMKQFSVGAEFSSALLYYNVGGSAYYEFTSQSIPSPIEAATQTSFESYKGIRFAKILSSFNVSIWF